ncbi:MAG: hypothetical protein H6625_00140 [Bdellovibrionaceae bacterium]|nr:hypothetical protein [Pseudobdellovibrionaceae bacterium]
MRNKKIIALLSLTALFFGACTKGQPEFALLNSLLGIQFEGKVSKTITINNLDFPIDINGSCDRTTTEILISKDKGNTWEDAKSVMGSQLSESCRQKGELKFKFLTDNTGFLKFTTGVASTHKLLVKAKAGSNLSSQAEINIKYEPTGTPQPKPVAGIFVTPAAGVVSSANYKMSFRVKAANVQAEGTNYKIKSIH